MRKYGCDRKTVCTSWTWWRHIRKGSMKVLTFIFTGRIAFMTLVSPIELQLCNVIPELCVHDVLEKVAEVDMSSSNPVSGDSWPDWLQPFDENVVDQEEQRGDRVEENEDTQDDDQEREEVVAQGERARSLREPRLPSRREVQEHELTHIFHHSWYVHCVRGAGRFDGHRRPLSSAVAESYRLVRASAETMGLVSMYKDPCTHLNGVVLGDASPSDGDWAKWGIGTNCLWMQEKAPKGDLNFKKVAGVERGADLFTKICRGMRNWATSTNGAHNLCRMRSMWTTSVLGQTESIFFEYCKKRVLPSTENWKHGLEQTWALERDPQLRKVDLYGVMWLLVSPQMLSVERSSIQSWTETFRDLEQTLLEGWPRDVQNILIFEASNVRSPSPTLQDTIRRGGVRGYQGSGDVHASSLLHTWASRVMARSPWQWSCVADDG